MGVEGKLGVGAKRLIGPITHTRFLASGDSRPPCTRGSLDAEGARLTFLHITVKASDRSEDAGVAAVGDSTRRTGDALPTAACVAPLGRAGSALIP